MTRPLAPVIRKFIIITDNPHAMNTPIKSHDSDPKYKQKEVMEFLRRGDIGRAFSQLQQFVLPGVTPTGKVLGTGSYGSVEEVSL